MTSDILLRTSERTTWARCRQQWAWGYNDKLKPRVDRPALRFGTLIHKALEHYYIPGNKRGPLPWVTFDLAYHAELVQVMERYAFKDEDDTWHDALQLGTEMLKGYVAEFQEVDANYTVLASEQRFRVPVYNSKGKLAYTYVGTLDGVWRHKRTKRISFIDFKTASTIKTDHLPLDEQSGAYWTYGVDWCLQQGILKSSRDLDGIIFRFLRKAMPDQRPRNELGQCLNKNGSVSERQPSPLFLQHVVQRSEYDREHVRLRAWQQAKEMHMARTGKLAVYKTPGTFTCMGCGFRDMCELHETGADWETFRDATMGSWDPYGDHELESEGKE